jgi:hypothetical protein
VPGRGKKVDIKKCFLISIGCRIRWGKKRDFISRFENVKFYRNVLHFCKHLHKLSSLEKSKLSTDGI